jgi:hypothetical protein
MSEVVLRHLAKSLQCQTYQGTSKCGQSDTKGGAHREQTLPFVETAFPYFRC